MLELHRKEEFPVEKYNIGGQIPSQPVESFLISGWPNIDIFLKRKLQAGRLLVPKLYSYCENINLLILYLIKDP